MAAKSNIAQFSEELTKTISQIHRFSQVLLKSHADPFIKGIITLPQYIILDILASGGPLKMKDIAHIQQITLPAVTGMIDRLVGLKMVRRIPDENDRRVIFIAITQSGKRVLESVKNARKKIIEQMFSDLTDEERKTYLSIIRKVEKKLYAKIN